MVNPATARAPREIIYDATPGAEAADLAWPYPPVVLHDMIERSLAAWLAVVAEADDEFTRRLLLAAPWLVLGYTWGGYEKVLCLQGEQASGLRFVSDSADMAFLRGAAGANPPPPELPNWMQHLPAPGLSQLRRVATVASWQPWWRAPMAMLGDGPVAVTFNALMRRQARDQRPGLDYCEPRRLLNRARARAAGVAIPGEAAAAAERVADALVALPELAPPYAGRLRVLVANMARAAFAAAARDLVGLGSLRRFPLHVWSGTAGSYPARLIGQEAMRRGGRADRFDHGGSSGITSPAHSLALNELSVSSRFVMATGQLAAIVRSDHGGDGACEIAGADGFPHLLGLPLDSRRPAADRPRVMYLSSFSRSDRKNPTHSMPQRVCDDWSRRIAARIAALPVELRCQPHPASFPPTGEHPLAAIAPVGRRPFEEGMEWADVFVCDVANSTAFWEVLCSDRPVVFLDLGFTKLAREIDAMLGARCRVLRAAYDDANLPQIAGGELADAVMDLAAPDPSAFRALLMGDLAR